MTRADLIAAAVVVEAELEGADPVLWAIRRASSSALVADLKSRGWFNLAEVEATGPARLPDLESEILEILGEDPSSSGELCELIEAEAVEIREALERLAGLRLIRGTPLTQEGWSARTWRLVDDE